MEEVPFFRWGGWEVNLEQRTVRGEGNPFRVSKAEIRVLMVILRAKGRVLRRELIMDSLYGDCPNADMPGEKILEVWICRLRRKHPELRRHLATVWGTGYFMRAREGQESDAN